MRILLTFSGFHDPYTMGLIGQEEQPGPIISLVKFRNFDRIILFSTPNTGKNTSDTKDVILSLNPRIEVEIKDISRDYAAALATAVKKGVWNLPSGVQSRKSSSFFSQSSCRKQDSTNFHQNVFFRRF